MTKKKLPQTIEDCNAELQRTRGQNAAGQKKRPVALPCNIRIMCHDHHGSLQIVSQLPQAMDHNGGILLVQRSGRLVRQYDFLVIDHTANDGNPLPFAARQMLYGAFQLIRNLQFRRHAVDNLPILL